MRREGSKLIMSKSEWQAIGKIAGWTVTAEVAHRPPKAWFDKMKKRIKKSNPDYSEEQVSETVGNIWYNELTDGKRSRIYKRHNEGKSPNK